MPVSGAQSAVTGDPAKIARAAFTFDIALRNPMRQSVRGQTNALCAIRFAAARFTVKRLLKGGSLRRKLDKSRAQSDASYLRRGR